MHERRDHVGDGLALAGARRAIHDERPPVERRRDALARILDWARAFTGPGLLDLASWRDTPLPLDVTAIAEMIGAYIAAGGPESAAAERGGLPAEVWAGGWHRVWICEWYLRQRVHWMPDPEADEAIQRVVRRHLTEAEQCLT
ncbi:hypothetical protein GCM10009527_096970 [Actinomadura nitritigenes]|uniref:Uncharacterized protein n=1 Tax=Actinomadura nitritigenes TaxID=134602 RepID=A0ABS3RIH7_9ACTN|nr:hypothetical protein [Actinomadura nitritigenes]MBO2445418.1 hypothetical protein [Actinomadura nitritigenes]